MTVHYACPVERRLVELKIGNYSIIFHKKKVLSLDFVACEVFNGSHTGCAIGAKLLSVLQKNSIESKFHIILSDNAPNMIKGSY